MRWTRKLALGTGVGLVLVIALTVLVSPGEVRICEHMFRLARAGGQDPAEAGVDDASCRVAVAGRRARMGPVRRTTYGICVVMADTLDEVGQC